MIVEKLVFLTNFYCDSEFRLCFSGFVFAIVACCFFRCWAFMHNFCCAHLLTGSGAESVTVA